MGKCKDCKWLDSQNELNRHENGGYCTHPKLYECGVFTGKGPEYDDDHLVYDFQECGGFWVGFEFGCVHWEAK